MHIRQETQDDIDAISALLCTAFGREDEARLVRRMRQLGDVALSLVAEKENQIVGQAILSRLSWPSAALALAPVAVAERFRRRGIAARLIEDLVAWAWAQNYKALFVLGEPSYYNRFGFTCQAAASIRSPFPPNYFMALEKEKGYLAAIKGDIIYSLAFSPD